MNVKPCMQVLQIELNRKYPLNFNVVYLMCTLLKRKQNQPNKQKQNKKKLIKTYVRFIASYMHSNQTMTLTSSVLISSFSFHCCLSFHPRD